MRSTTHSTPYFYFPFCHFTLLAPLLTTCPLSGPSGRINLRLRWAASPHQHWRGDRQTHLSCTAVSDASAQTYTGHYVQVSTVKELQKKELELNFEFSISCEKCSTTQREINLCVFQVQPRWILPSGTGGFSPEQSTGYTGGTVRTTGLTQRLWKHQHRDSNLPTTHLLTNTHIHTSHLDVLFYKDKHMKSDTSDSVALSIHVLHPTAEIFLWHLCKLQNVLDSE